MKHWKTTAAGVLAAIATVNINGVTWKSLLAATATALIGLLAKDFNVGQ